MEGGSMEGQGGRGKAGDIEVTEGKEGKNLLGR